MTRSPSYHALTLAAVIRASGAPEQSAQRQELEGSLAALRKLADSGPHTYAHKHLLVAAELAGLEGRDLEAMRLYERAVRSAAEQGSGYTVTSRGRRLLPASGLRTFRARCRQSS